MKRIIIAVGLLLAGLTNAHAQDGYSYYGGAEYRYWYNHYYAPQHGGPQWWARDYYPPALHNYYYGGPGQAFRGYQQPARYYAPQRYVYQPLYTRHYGQPRYNRPRYSYMHERWY